MNEPPTLLGVYNAHASDILPPVTHAARGIKIILVLAADVWYRGCGHERLPKSSQRLLRRAGAEAGHKAGSRPGRHGVLYGLY